MSSLHGVCGRNSESFEVPSSPQSVALNADCWLEIFSHLLPQDLNSLSLVNLEFLEISQSDVLWKKYYAPIASLWERYFPKAPDKLSNRSKVLSFTKSQSTFLKEIFELEISEKRDVFEQLKEIKEKARSLLEEEQISPADLLAKLLLTQSNCLKAQWLFEVLDGANLSAKSKEILDESLLASLSDLNLGSIDHETWEFLMQKEAQLYDEKYKEIACEAVISTIRY